MSDWQISTLRALGLSARGLAGGVPPGSTDPLASPFGTRRDAPSPIIAAAAQPSPLTPPPFPPPPAPHDPLASGHQTGPAPAPSAHAPQNEPPPYTAPSPAAPAPEAQPGQSEPPPYGGGTPAAPAPHDPLTARPPVPEAQAMRGEPPHGGGGPVVPAPPDPLAARPPAPVPEGRSEPAPYGGVPQPSTPPVAEAGQGRTVAPVYPGVQHDPGAGVHPDSGGHEAALYGGAGMPGGPTPEEEAWAQGSPSSGTPIADELVRRMRHGDPLARRMGRGVRRAVGARAAQTVREQEAAAGILGQVVSSCRRIAVTSLRGGAGKTTVTALVARTIAAHRGDRTLVLDADPSLGSLPLRLGVDAERAYRGLTTLPNWEAAQSYLTQAGERLWVASASASRSLDDELTLAEFQTAQGEFSRYFGISLVDCGPGLTSDLHQGILASSHAQILIAPATADGALSTRSALDWFLRSPHSHLLQRTLVVLVTHTPHLDGDLNRSRALLAAEGVPVIHLPYDRHLAAGTAVDPALLAETSQATAIHLATAAFTRATT
ncbi:MinD/ParA family ATP-binding protein [Actinocorallia populi]|uniref:MinD/ParA family ATP-binding protein n=1 Tax=Actinocorallia populi TaxID=2079200 RepID=UPI000D093F97|nr:MinD/ParA family protein [Actinocorallia populi]